MSFRRRRGDIFGRGEAAPFLNHSFGGQGLEVQPVGRTMTL